MGTHATTHRRLLPTVAIAAALAAPLLLGACGKDSASPGTASTTTTPAGTATSQRTFPNEGGAVPMPITGTVSAREGQCLLFTPGDMAVTWVLKGQVEGLQPGDRVEISGSLSDVMDPACPQGQTVTVTKFVKK